MPLTYTGRNVTLENDEHPSILDIAVGLSRMPRFAGQTWVWWSVLDHTLFGDYLLAAADAGRGLRLAWLLHDAHEALTGDVPTPFKSAGLRVTQAQLDTKIIEALGRGVTASYFDQVKDMDKRVMVAEAWEIGPPAAFQALQGAFPRLEETPSDTDTLRWLMKNRPGVYGDPPYREQQDSHPGVRAYLDRMARLS
jgi:hypothetical protein